MEDEKAMDKPRISFLTDRLYIRSVEESDKEDYMALRIATSELAEAYESNPAFGDHEWAYELNSSCDVYLSVLFQLSAVALDWNMVP